MSRYKVYIKPYKEENVYADEFIDVSRDVINIGEISQSLDNSTYDIGIFKTSGLKIRFRNDHGRFSDTESSNSLFSYNRQDSIVKVTWAAQDYPITAGFFTLNPITLGSEVTIFEGLLYDISGVSSIEDQYIDFRFAGFDSLLERMTVPFSDILNGDTFSEVIYKMLNQTELTQYVTVDQANIVCAVDETIDDKSSLENKTVREALDDEGLLLVASSALYIKDGVVYVQGREPSVEVEHSFYGQASLSGIENIMSIKDYRDGVNKIFNYLSWAGTTLLQTLPTSIGKYGTRKLEVSTDLIDSGSTSKIQNILGKIRDDFSLPKRELKLETPLSYQTIDLFLKDKVDIDYPTIYVSGDENPIPRWGRPRWGAFVWPIGQFSLLIQPVDKFKVMSKKINVKNDTIIFDLREV